MKLLTIAWTLVAVCTWCCDSAIVYEPLVRNTRWYDPRIPDLELLDVSDLILVYRFTRNPRRVLAVGPDASQTGAHFRSTQLFDRRVRREPNRPIRFSNARLFPRTPRRRVMFSRGRHVLPTERTFYDNYYSTPFSVGVEFSRGRPVSGASVFPTSARLLRRAI